jgi:hypothetical protein
MFKKSFFNFQRVFNILVTLVLMLLVVSQAASARPEKRCSMAIEFPDSSSLTFPNNPAMVNMAQKTYTAWIYSTGDQALNHWHSIVFLFASDGFSATTLHFWLGPDYNELWFINRFSGSYGYWRSSPTTFLNNHWYHVAVTYDNSNVANNPVFYINGAAESTIVLTPPTGTAFTDTQAIPVVGGAVAALQPYPYGKSILADVRIYNRLLSAAEIAEIASTRSLNAVRKGLLFQMPGLGASGMNPFDGVALGGSNQVIDSVSGLAGVPYGSPIGRADSILCGGN